MTLLLTLALPALILIAFVLLHVRSHLTVEGRQRVQLLSQLLGETVDEELGGLKALIASAATRPSLCAAIQDGNTQAVEPHLRGLVEQSPRISRAFITDAAGIEKYDYPHDPSVIGVSFAHRDWYRGAAASGGPYISEVYERAALGQPLVLAVATPIRGPGGETIAYLVGQYTLAELKARIGGLTLGESVSLALVDQAGTVVVGPSGGAASDSDVQQLAQLALGSPRPTQVTFSQAGPHVTGLTRVPASGWSAIAFQPVRTVHAPVVEVLRLIPVVFLACFLVMATLAGMAFRTLRRYNHAWHESEQALIGATESAEAANRAKSDFLAIMSHELRTPLNGVIGMVELLRTTGLNDRQTRFAEACHANAHTLMAIINDILDFSKIEAGRLDLDDDEFVLTQCVDDAVALTAHRAHEKGLELSYYVEPAVRARVCGDSLRLRQVLVNLLSNAIKFTHHGQVILRIVLDSRTTSELTIRCSISDSGIGIPAERLDRVFRPFSQVDRRTTRRYGGTGLGLSICKSLVEAMGGEIGVESDAGSGSTFWFTARFAATPSDDVRPLTPSDLRGMRVALISSNYEGRAILAETLSSWQMHVDRIEPGEATDGSIGRNGQDPPFDLLIIDLPVRDHTEDGLHHLIAAHRQLAPRVVVLHATNTAPPSGPDHAVEPPWFLRKPPSPSELHDTLLQACCSAAPAHAPPADPEPSQAGPAQSRDKCAVLLAEDHPTSQLYVSEVLRQNGYECDVVTTGREAVEAAGRRRYHIILMDCQMPELDGFGATAEIRAMEAAGMIPGHTPIIALTANAIKGDRERCLAAGMDDYLSKPVEPRTLLQRLAAYATEQPGAARLNGADQAQAGVADGGAPLDAEAALARCMGNAALLKAALESFTRETPEMVEQLAAAARAGDLDTAAKHAHAIKGASGLITAERLSAVARSVELAAADGAHDAMTAKIEAMQDELERVLRFIQSHAAAGIGAADSLPHTERSNDRPRS